MSVLYINRPSGLRPPQFPSTAQQPGRPSSSSSSPPYHLVILPPPIPPPSLLPYHTPPAPLSPTLTLASPQPHSVNPSTTPPSPESITLKDYSRKSSQAICFAMENFSIPRLLPGVGPSPAPAGSSIGMGGIPGFAVIQRLLEKVGLDPSFLGGFLFSFASHSSLFFFFLFWTITR